MKDREIKAWELERYLLGELTEQRMREIEQLKEENPEIQKEIERLRQSSRDILEKYPVESMVPEILRLYEEAREKKVVREQARPIFWRRFLYAVPALAAALVLLFVVLFKTGPETFETRIKGEDAVDMTKTQIIIYRKKAGEAEILKNGDPAQAGDLLQIAYVPAGKAYGVIFSIDGNGIVTLHFPEERDGSSLLKEEQKILLGASYELDDAPGFERFFFVTSMSEINVQDILERAEALAESPDLAKQGIFALPVTYSQFSILLNKGEGQ